MSMVDISDGITVYNAGRAVSGVSRFQIQFPNSPDSVSLLQEKTDMQSKLALTIVGVVFALAGSRVLAHHSFAAEFDADKPVTLRGTVTKMEWVNPHSWLHIDVKDGEKVVNWAIEMGAPNAMLRRGWNNKSIPIGAEVIVSGWQAKNGTSMANGNNVTLPDGKKLFVGSSGTGAPGDTGAGK